MFDYPLWWITSSYDLMMFANDMAYVRAHYPNLLSVLDDFYPSVTNPATGLIERHVHHPPFFGSSSSSPPSSPPSSFPDETRKSCECRWGDYAFINRKGPVTYYNALYVRGLRQGAAMARELGHDVDAERWEDRADDVARALRKLNWDTSVGAFYDGTTLGCDDEDEDRSRERYVDTHALDGNSLAILEGIVPTRAARGIMAHFDRTAHTGYGTAFYDNTALASDHNARVYPFIAYFELKARFEAQLPSSAHDLMAAMWTRMGHEAPGVTAWEGMGADYETAFISRAHGWSTGVVALCSAHVLGVRPTRPGYAEWEVKPRPVGALSWARGAVPVPAGEGGGGLREIAVKWAVGGDARPTTSEDKQRPVVIFEMTVEAPAGTSGTIAVPTVFSGMPGDFATARAADAMFDADEEWDGVRVYVDGEMAVQVLDGERTVKLWDGALGSRRVEFGDDGFVGIRGVAGGRPVVVRVERVGLGMPCTGAAAEKWRDDGGGCEGMWM